MKPSLLHRSRIAFVPALLLPLAGLALGLRGPAPQEEAATPPAPITVILVRHAETAGSTRSLPDPPLSTEGAERAAALGALLGHSGATHLFSSDLQRTRATLGPLAEALGLEIASGPPLPVEPLAATLGALPPGSTAVVAGHSNTVPALVEALGGTIPGLERHPQHGPLLDHGDYDRLFWLTLPACAGESVKTIELRYGAP